MEGAQGPNIKPFECGECFKRFTRRENLKRHQRSGVYMPMIYPHCLFGKSIGLQLHYNTIVLIAESISLADLGKRHVKKYHPPLTHHQVEIGQDDFEVSSYQIDLGHNDAMMAVGSSVSPASTTSSSLLLSQYIATYFDKCHPTLPIIHFPTFDIARTDKTLVQALACLGAVYGLQEERHDIGTKLFDEGYDCLNQYVKEDRHRFEEIWVFQAFLLFEMFAIYSCDDRLFLLGQQIHRDLVDRARSSQILCDDTIDIDFEETESGGSSRWSRDDDHLNLDDRWHIYVDQESRKRTIYALYFLDSQLSVICNVKPFLSAMEIKYELPCPDHIWSASTAAAWSELEQEQSSSFNEKDDPNGNAEPRPAQGNLYQSMKHLLHPGSVSQPLRFLWYSPFAALILVMQVQMMLRELTNASIFLYRNLRANDSKHNLCMIDESNRGPILHVLHNLGDIMPKRQNTEDDNSFETTPSHSAYILNEILWHSVWTIWHYTFIALTHQDALLSTGIVELSIPAAISSKPRAKSHRDVYSDQDVFRLLHNIEKVLRSMDKPPTCSTEGSQRRTCLEDPFITILNFKTCMIGWRLIRLMMLNMDQGGISSQSSSASEAPTRSVLLNIYAAIMRDGNLTGDRMVTDSNFMASGRDELWYLEWAHRTFRERSVWPVGDWIGAVLKESLDEAAVSSP
ncbi:hypothetical protein BP6252_03944 [Coleophoma cylindrospora]|uniref:C2H2-type domain-containing protein n=1 Tax=Coleophoma cylindrospora TaxID=1849047 RepID=A0A3D8S906_9HELO|nr:hypothetical protein BP6252_03944 [Coleophoma cylindrospora]